MSKFRLWNLYFCSEGRELELLQTRAQIEDCEGVTTNCWPPQARLFRSNNGDVGLGDLKSTLISSTIVFKALLIQTIIFHQRGNFCFTHNYKI